MTTLLTDLARSPIVQAFAAMAVTMAALFYLFGPRLMNSVLDGFTITGCSLVLVRFSSYALSSARKREPDGPDVLIVSVALVALSIMCLRTLRIFGVELGWIESDVIGYLFGACTVVMVFGIHLKVIAPQLRFGRLRMNPWLALATALAGGVFLSGLLAFFRNF